MSPASQIRVLRSREDIEAVRADWAGLGSLPEHDFETYWSSIRDGKRPVEPYVVAHLEEGRLRSALLGWVESTHVSLKLGYWTALRLPVRRIVLPVQGLLGPGDGGTLPEMVERVVAELRDRRADVAAFEYLEEGSALHGAARGIPLGFWMRDRVRERRIHHRLDLPTTFKEYDRQHKGLLQKVRKFEKSFAGRFQHRLFTGENEIEAFCQGADAVARRTYQRALGEGFLDSPEDRGRIRAAARRGAWRAFATLVDGKMVAFWSGCQVGAEVVLWWTAYDASYQEYSPGLVSSTRMVERLIASGVTALDFGGGDAPYKARLCNASRWEESVWFYAPGLRGALAGVIRSLDAAIGNLVRTRLKGLANRLKTPWRRLMARRLSRREATPPGPGGGTPAPGEQAAR